MNGPRRTPLHNPNADALAVFGLLLVVVLVVGGGVGRRSSSPTWPSTRQRRSATPFSWVSALVKGAWHWPRAATWWAAGEAAVVLALALASRRTGNALAGQAGLRRHRARLLGRDRPSLRRYIDPKAAPVAAEHGAGLQIGRDVLSGRMVRATWEDTHGGHRRRPHGQDHFHGRPPGPRRPRCRLLHVEQAGPVRPHRPGPAAQGRRVAVRPPRHRRHRAALVLVGPSGRLPGPSPRHGRIADVFASASRPPNASRDAYFDPASEELLATYLLAAAAGGEPVTAVHAWLANTRDDTAVQPPARNAGP